MSYTTTDLVNIERAIASGELIVSIEGKSVTYRSLGDLIKARDVINSDLQAQGVAEAPASSVSYAGFSKD